MTITARVQNHSITLPAEMDVPEGTEVQVTLPEPVAPVSDDSTDWMEEFVGLLDTLPSDAADRHNERAHGRKRQNP